MVASCTIMVSMQHNGFCPSIAVGVDRVWSGWAVVIAALAGWNILTMLVYGFDKRMARKGGRRIREASLHAMAALGGTPGAFLAQHLFRHKTRDRKFRLVFWLIVAAQVGALWAYAFLRQG